MVINAKKNSFANKRKAINVKTRKGLALFKPLIQSTYRKKYNRVIPINT